MTRSNNRNTRPSFERRSSYKEIVSYIRNSLICDNRRNRNSNSARRKKGGNFSLEPHYHHNHHHHHQLDQSQQYTCSSTENTSKSSEFIEGEYYTDDEEIINNTIVVPPKLLLKSCLKKEEVGRLHDTTVAFEKTVEVRYVPSLLNLCETYIDEIWFQEEEFSTIRQNAATLIQEAKTNEKNDAYEYEDDDDDDSTTTRTTTGRNSNEDDEDCIRGLERYFDNNEAVHMTSMARNSVFFEQQEQLRTDTTSTHGFFDSNRISDVYKLYTWRSIFDATKRGSSDQAEAEAAATIVVY
mmetsp:Transcript_35568/g.36073  ORF Transcript_35568/g.36073 Transcript_35568/m.36073 type:complete len:296 (+) Transcript_35568:92-979(+)